MATSPDQVDGKGAEKVRGEASLDGTGQAQTLDP